MEEESASASDHVVALCSKMNEYRRDDVYCDVELCVQGKLLESFKCHRLVLGAASNYFHVMFTGKFKESREPVVTLEGITANTLEKILNFIYTGEVSIDPTNLYELFHASEYFTLPDLEKACVKYIRECTSISLVENVSKLYSFFRAANKVDAVPRFLDQNIFEHFDNFYRTSEFLKISIDDLSRILENIKDCPQPNHDIFHKAIMRWTFYAVSHSPEEKRKFSKKLTEHIDFKKLSGQYMKYTTEKFIEHDGIEHPEADETSSQMQPCLHAFANNSSEYSLICVSELFSGGYENYGGDFEWSRSYRFLHQLPDFMRTVQLNNDLCCLSYTERTMTGILRRDITAMKPTQKFIMTSSVSLFPKLYLASPPLLLRNFEMCRIYRNIYVYNKNAQSKVVWNGENSAKFDQEALSRAIYLYNIETDTWLPVPPLKQKFANACMTSSEQMLYLVGGTNSDGYVQGYDYRTSAWTELASTSGKFERAACCVSKAELYVSGGCLNPKKVETYNPIADKWRNETDMVQGLYDHEILLNKGGECITYNKYLAPESVGDVFSLDGKWTSNIYRDIIKRTQLYNIKVIHMTLFKPYGF